MSKFLARVTGMGEMAQEFIDEGILVFFADRAPEELQDVAVIHDDRQPLKDDVVPGDVFRLGDNTLKVLAVGQVASENFRNLGHIVMKFNGLNEPEMGGDINVPAVPVPDIKPGMEIELLTGNGKD